MYSKIPLPALLRTQGSDDEPLSLTQRRENIARNAEIIHDWANQYGINEWAGSGAEFSPNGLYDVVSLYNANLANIELWLAGGDPHNWNSRFPEISRSEYPTYDQFITKEITDGNIIMNGALPITLNTSGVATGNTGADAYRTTFFWHTPNHGDVFSIAPIVLAAVFVGAAVGGYLTAYTAGAEIGAGTAAIETGTVVAVGEPAVGASAWEAAAAEAAAWEAAAAEPLVSWSAASAEVAAAEAGAAAVAPSAVPSTGGFSLPSAQQIAQKALPYALKELTKPDAPVAPPRQAAPVPAAIGFQPYDPYSDPYLTGPANNTMLYIAGGIALALVAAVTLSQRKG